MPRKSKVQKREKHRRLVQGVKKHWMNQGNFEIAGVKYTPSDLVDGLESLIRQHDRTARAYSAWREEVKRERRLEKDLGPLVRGVQNQVLSYYGVEATKKLGDFGMKYTKRGPKTLASKRQMVAEARATRAERHTMGSRQRKRVKGGG
jgi:hypothetical protein